MTSHLSSPDDAMKHIAEQTHEIERLAAEAKEKLSLQCETADKKITTATDSLIDNIQECRKELFEEIEAYQSDTIRKYEESKESKYAEVKAHIDECDTFVGKWSQRVNDPQMSDAELTAAIESARELEQRMSHEEEKYRVFVFDNRFIEFTPNTEKLDRDMVGTLSGVSSTINE